MGFNMKALTKKPERVFDFLHWHIRELDNLPPVQVIADEFDWATNTVQCYLKIVEREGYIEKYRKGWKRKRITV